MKRNENRLAERVANAGRCGEAGFVRLGLLALVVATAGGVIWAESRHACSGCAQSAASSPAAIQGDLISPPAAISSLSTQASGPAEAKPRRHEPIPSTQKRMVMYQLKMEQLVDEQP